MENKNPIEESHKTYNYIYYDTLGNKIIEKIPKNDKENEFR